MNRLRHRPEVPLFGPRSRFKRGEGRFIAGGGLGNSQDARTTACGLAEAFDAFFPGPLKACRTAWQWPVVNAPPQPSFNETAETSPGDALAAVTALQADVMGRPGVRLGNRDEISRQFLDHQSVTKTGGSAAITPPFPGAIGLVGWGRLTDRAQCGPDRASAHGLITRGIASEQHQR